MKIKQSNTRSLDWPTVLALADSMQMQGFTSTILVDENGKILDGNHRVAAAELANVKVRYKVQACTKKL